MNKAKKSTPDEPEVTQSASKSGDYDLSTGLLRSAESNSSESNSAYDNSSEPEVVPRRSYEDCEDKY
ncbi:MAG: hypothetical protein M1544_01725 [Candidatus Marsarchaeota archaeon]|nr:hypothetical protein [Candidatus Marsarchaeota archaeon]MCL5102055.1 hypothetical protein [Candidatus Marsarchaeota archaeon]